MTKGWTTARSTANPPGQSANGLKSHEDWIKDINEVTGSNLKFPIIADPERKVAYLYDMVDYQDTTNVDEKGPSMLGWRCFSLSQEADRHQGWR